MAYREVIEAWRRGERPLAPITELLGVTPVDVGDGTASLALEVDARFHSPMGRLHGGVFADLADMAMGVALATAVAEGETFATLELSVSFFRPVVAGRLVGAARVVRRGRESAHLVCDVHEGDQLVAGARSVCLIRPRGVT